MVRRALLSVLVGFGCLGGAAAQAGYPDDGKVIFRNYSSAQVILQLEGAADSLILSPYRGRGSYVKLNRFTQHTFLLDANGDLVTDGAAKVTLQETKKATFTIGDFGLQGLLAGP